MPLYHSCAQTTPSPEARPAAVSAVAPPGVRDVLSERVMVSVDSPGKSDCNVCWTTLHDICDSAYTVGIVEHVMLVLSAVEPSDVDELTYFDNDAEHPDAVWHTIAVSAPSLQPVRATRADSPVQAGPAHPLEHAQLLELILPYPVAPREAGAPGEYSDPPHAATEQSALLLPPEGLKPGGQRQDDPEDVSLP